MPSKITGYRLGVPRPKRALNKFVAEVENMIPKEISFGWIFFPPMFIATVLGLTGAILISIMTRILGISRWFWHPTLAFLALTVLLSALIGIFFVPF